jgi:hypothetical protein
MPRFGCRLSQAAANRAHSLLGAPINAAGRFLQFYNIFHLFCQALSVISMVNQRLLDPLRVL